MARKYFGTDGIRGRVGEVPISPDYFLKLGWAVGNVLVTAVHADKRTKVLIGKDTRISGYMFESALEAGLVAAGVDVHLLGPMPTPGVAYLTRTLQAGAGIVISASHNQHADNGIKFFATDGSKLADEIEYNIEAYLERANITTVESRLLGRAVRVNDAQGRYIEFCKSTFPKGLNLRGLKIVVDCANGASYNIAPNVFEELGATVIPIAANPDGLNINLGCGATNPQLLAAKVKEVGADVGIALDGDGDRVIFVDHTGEVVDGDELLCIIARWYQHKSYNIGGVAGTLMSNYGLELAFARMGIPFCRTNVGDRYVLEALRQRSWLLGGESSGHIICLDAHSTGDGIIAALRVLALLVSFGQTLFEQKQLMQKYPQLLINIPIKGAFDLNAAVIKAAVVAAENKLQKQGRVLLRASGTEPLVRVMVEGLDSGLVKLIAEDLVSVISGVVADA